METFVRQLSARQILRQFVTEVTADSEEISYSNLIAEAQEELGNDEEFVSAAAQDMIAALMPELVREVMRQRRHEMISVSSGYVSEAKIRLRAMDRITRVFEGTGTGGYKSLALHKKVELQHLNERDRAQVAATKKWIGFRTDLIDNMDEEQMVADLHPLFLDRTWTKHFG